MTHFILGATSKLLKTTNVVMSSSEIENHSERSMYVFHYKKSSQIVLSVEINFFRYLQYKQKFILYVSHLIITKNA